MVKDGENMNIDILHDKKNELEFVLPDESHGFSRLLVDELLKNKDVEVAQYNISHPLIGKPHFLVKTKSKAPKDAVKKALKSIKKELETIK